MPHLQLELSKGVREFDDRKSILRGLVEEFCAFESIDPRAVKGYVRVAEDWVMGSGAPENFVHLTVCVLAGRDPALLSRISDALFARMKTAFQTSMADGAVGLTLEVREMNPAGYRK